MAGWLMAVNPRRVDERLEALYARLPLLACQGLCSDSCGPIRMSVRERERIERAAGRAVSCASGASCSMLTAQRRCGVYALRPLICRLWGIIESLACPYGCVPRGGRIPDLQGWQMLVEADQIAGARSPARLRADVTGLAAFTALAEDTQRRVSQDLGRVVVGRPTLAGRAGQLPRSIIER